MNESSFFETARRHLTSEEVEEVRQAVRTLQALLVRLEERLSDETQPQAATRAVD